MNTLVVLSLWENGDWKDHDLQRPIAKEVALEIIKQISDEPLEWLAERLTNHSLELLASAIAAEVRARELSKNRTQERPRVLGVS